MKSAAFVVVLYFFYLQYQSLKNITNILQICLWVFSIYISLISLASLYIYTEEQNFIFPFYKHMKVSWTPNTHMNLDSLIMQLLLIFVENPFAMNLLYKEFKAIMGPSNTTTPSFTLMAS